MGWKTEIAEDGNPIAFVESDSEAIARIEEKVDRLLAVLIEFQPLLDKVRRTTKPAKGFSQLRKGN